MNWFGSDLRNAEGYRMLPRATSFAAGVKAESWAQRYAIYGCKIRYILLYGTNGLFDLLPPSDRVRHAARGEHCT